MMRITSKLSKTLCYYRSWTVNKLSEYMRLENNKQANGSNDTPMHIIILPKFDAVMIISIAKLTQ